MKKFEYNISIPASTQRDADEIMKAVIKVVPRLTPEEWSKIAEVVCNPVQLSIIKSKLGL
jgi:hypothetical protein